MNPLKAALIVSLAALGAFGVGTAQARSDVSWSIGINAPLPGVHIGTVINGGPAYYPPPPVYRPAPRYYGPAPRYYRAPPVAYLPVYGPPPVVGPPLYGPGPVFVPGPVMVMPQPVWVPPGQRRHWRR